ncbi:DUF2163 domain-containing protein [Xanthobacter dioxanivorans]|uniref:DUF2163 domain-containing protein n=1 Tax=Xanthobacter dioxanivorans TaxID=2528964 RepID=A0A974SGL9_9HYPH|nr:DUF2163 domain-containing protein [Xanthobacter dioxanivorans]QRG04840.1 DUF2163 domain-containing protein [Xanthobacter dioxanivorans]
MRTLAPALSAHLASGATTLCHGWRVTRRDGVVLGFTDHDRDLVVDGLLLKAASGISGSESTSAAGLSVTGAELSGALSADALDAGDLAAGLYDGAAIDLLLVNWQEPSQALLLRRGTIGEVRCADGVFTAEIRALADGLNQSRGRLLTAACDADLGDARCGVDLADPAHCALATVSVVEGALRLRVTGLSAFAAGAFARGKARVASGACAGFVTEVKAHLADAEGVVLRLWQRPPFEMAEGDTLALTAGCDKRFTTCRDRFANAVNFRGFPHMPGNDFIITVAIPGEGGYDGSLME